MKSKWREGVEREREGEGEGGKREGEIMGVCERERGGGGRNDVMEE